MQLQKLTNIEIFSKKFPQSFNSTVAYAFDAFEGLQATKIAIFLAVYHNSLRKTWSNTR